MLKALDQNKISENTLVLFSTDNGCTPHRFDDAMRKAKHFPNGNLRGGKGDLFDGGHRVPLVVRWPAVVPASSKTDRLTCLTDFISTCSEIVEQDLDQASGVDGVSFLSTLKNPKVISNRKAIVHHSFHGNFSIREGNWKLNLHAGSGGFTKLNDREKALEKEGKLPDVQLYDLSKDIGELKNVQAQHPQKVQELTQLLQSYVEKGRSNQGEPQQNDRQVNIFDVQ